MADPRAYVRAGNSEKSVTDKQTNRQTDKQTMCFETVTNVNSASRKNTILINVVCKNLGEHKGDPRAYVRAETPKNL